MDKLLKEYYKLFPNTRFFPEWFDIPNKEKIEILKEAIKDKKNIIETKLYERYEETVINIKDAK